MRLVHSSKYDINVSEDTVIRELLRFGASMTRKGFSYMVDAILLLVSDDTRLHDVTRGIYGYIADLHNEKPANVERCMRDLFRKTSIKNPEFMKKILPLNLDPRYDITLSEFLAYFYNHIINRIYDEIYGTELHTLGYMEPVVANKDMDECVVSYASTSPIEKIYVSHW